MSRLLNAMFSKTCSYLIVSKRMCSNKDLPTCSIDNKPKTKSGEAGASSPSDTSRIVRGEPGKVELGFIPVHWITSFYEKTGVTGFYTFCFTFGTYLISKEKFVMEHNYYGGISFAILWWLVATKAGPLFAKTVDKEIDAIETAWNEGRVNEKNMLDESIKDEEKAQWSMDGQLLLIEAKRENVALQLEADYRERLMTVYTDTKNCLDYQVELQNIERRMLQKNIVDWVTNQVLKSITPEEENKNIDQCIATLASMAGGSSGGSSPPSGGTVPPSGGTVPPSGGTVPPSDGTAPPSDGSPKSPSSTSSNVCKIK